MKTKITDYKILEQSSKEKLEKEVLEYVQKGYVLNGSLIVQGEYQYTTWVQGIVLYERPMTDGEKELAQGLDEFFKDGTE